MVQFNYDDFIKMTSKQTTTTNNTVGKRVSYFGLADSGDSAIVRFDVSGAEDIKVSAVHSVVNSSGKRRNVFCLRSPQEPLEKCPLCESGESVSYRVFVKVIRYNVGDSGVEAEPTFWSAPLSVGKTLKALAADYGNLRDYVFKVTREGRKGDTRTSYTILPANPNIYKPEVYKADFSIFDSFNMNYFVMERTAEDMREFLESGDFPNPYVKQADNTVETPQSTASANHIARTYSDTTIELQPNTTNTTDNAPVTGPRRYSY